MTRAIALLLFLFITATAGASTESEVNYLIGFVAGSGCDFYRNDKRYDSIAAADHLRNKYRNGRRWVNSAEQFIQRIASGSSISGKPYHVVCGDTRLSSRQWLERALEQHRAASLAD